MVHSLIIVAAFLSLFHVLAAPRAGCSLGMGDFTFLRKSVRKLLVCQLLTVGYRMAVIILMEISPVLLSLFLLFSFRLGECV